MAETYNITLDGQSISVPAWATEATLAKVAKALNVTEAGSVSAVIKKFGGKGSTDPKTVVGAAGAAAGSLDRVSSSSIMAERAFNAIAGTAEGIATVGSSILNSGGSFQALNPVIDLTTDLLGGLAKMIPVVGDGLAQLIGIVGDIVKMANGIMDEFLDAFDGVAMQGMGLQTSFVQLQQAALEGRISLQDLFAVTGRAAEGVIALGGSFDEGVNRFIQIQNNLTGTDSKFRLALESFGLSAVDTAEFLGDFLETQKGNLLLNTMSNEQLAATAFKVIKNNRIIAELTGTQVDDLKAQQRAVAANQSFQARLQQLRNQDMVKEALALQTFVEGLPTDTAKQAAMEILAFGGALVTAETNLVNFATGGALQQSIAQGIDSIFASGGNLDILPGLIAPVGDAVALVAENNTALQAAVVNLTGNTNEFGNAVEGVLEKSRQIVNIQENAGTTLTELSRELMQATQEQIEAITSGELGVAVDEFNANLISARSNLDLASSQLEALVLDGIKPLMAAYADNLETLTGALTDVLEVLKAGGSFADAADALGPQKTEDSLMDDFIEIAGGIALGAAGGAMYGAAGGPITAAGGAIVGGVVAGLYQGAEAIFGDDFMTNAFSFGPDSDFEIGQNTKTAGTGSMNPDVGKADASILAALERQNQILEESNKHLKNTEKNTQGPARSF